MADFNWSLNRQGLRGPQGEKGDDGGTPTISVSEQTSSTYKLLITNADGVNITTPNLRGNFVITDNGGKYVMYVNGELQANDPIIADTGTAGALRVAVEADFTAPKEKAAIAVNPYGVIHAIPKIVSSASGSIVVSENLDGTTNLELGTTIKIGDTTLSEAQLIQLLALIPSTQSDDDGIDFDGNIMG